MSISAIVRALVASGATPEMIAAAVEAAEGERIRLDEERKEKRRQATRRWRTKGVMSRDITRHHSDHADGVIYPEEDIPPSPPKGGSSPQGAKRVRKKPLVPIPDDFEPDIEEAINEGLPRTDAIREARSLRDWALSNDIRKADWPATWRTWFRRKIAEQARAPPGRVNGIGRHHETPHETLRRAFEDEIAEIKGTRQ